MMSVVVSELRLVRGAVASRVIYFVAMARRTMPGPALLRLIAVAGALVALAVVVPSSLLSSSRVLLLLPAGVVVGLFPRTRSATLVALLAVGAWLVATIGFDQTVSWWRTAALSAGLYVMHAATAMAAVMPYDAAVAPAALVRWAVRLIVVVVGSLTVAVGGMAVFEQVPAVRTLAAPIIGSAIAAGIVGLLAWHLRRR